MEINYNYTGLEIAVIGMSGRFPGAHNLQEYWDNIREGIEAISTFSDEELIEQGISPEEVKKANYVKAKGVFPDVEYFDYELFKYTPKDALNMDPQVRALHQEVYHALEDAGYISDQYKGNIGLIVGASGNFKWEAQSLSNAAQNEDSSFAVAQLCDKDFAATRIAYALNLKGPCYTLHSACSSSLLAIDMACKSLLTGACKIVVACGSSISLPYISGYEYVKGMIYSPDGHCRAFDETAQGTVEGNGAGAVVLKNLEQAIKDGDHIYAVIKGSSSNNDGNRKVGFTAPSVEGQADVIKKALYYADVDADTIGYVETHGTGTELGDPIEFDGLVQAFGGVEKDNCALGFVKAGIGHLDTAAGIAAFEKAVLALDNKTIPKCINFQKPNVYIDVENSPFYFCTQSKEWKRKIKDGYSIPLRAGVSSFGMGGTNVHVILEEAPRAQEGDPGRNQKLFTIAANSENAIVNMQKEYVQFLNENADKIDINDFVWSLQTKQRNFKYRYTTVFRDFDQLKEQLRESLETGNQRFEKADKKHIYFMFSGQGTQYPGMARALYQSEPYFREVLDECIDIAEKNGIIGLKELLLEPNKENSDRLMQTQMAQVALFSLEYSLAMLLMEWKIQPEALIGHSLGEIVAATVSGVFSLEDGIRVITARGKYMQMMEKGSMLGVTATYEEIQPLLSENVNVASFNTENRLTISGEDDAIREFASRCEEKGISVQKLHTSHAFHSYMMKDAMEPFIEVLDSVKKATPKIPFISNITGTWIDAEQVRSSSYYAGQLINSVQFMKGSIQIVEDDSIAIEIGLGNVLSTFVRANCKEKKTAVFNLLPGAKENKEGDAYFTKQLGKIWAAGAQISWQRYDFRKNRQRIKLPLYVFDKTEVSVNINEMKTDVSVQTNRAVPKIKREKRLTSVGWKQTIYPKCVDEEYQKVFLLITDKTDIQNVFNEIPRQRIIVAERSDCYSYQKNKISKITKNNFSDMRRLFYNLENDAMIPEKVIYFSENDDEMIEEAETLFSIVSEYEKEVEDCIFISAVKDDKKSLRLANFINALNLRKQNVRSRFLMLPDRNLCDKKSKELREILIREIFSDSKEDDNVVRYLSKGRFTLSPDEQMHEAGDKKELAARLIVTEKERLPQAVKMLENSVNPDTCKYVTYCRDKQAAFSKELFEDSIQDVLLKEEALYKEAGLGNYSKCYDKAEEYTCLKILNFVKTSFQLEKGTMLRREDLVKAFQTINSLERYIDYFLYVLNKYQYLEKREDSYWVTAKVLQEKDSDAIRKELAGITNLFEGQLNLLDYVMQNLADALNGKKMAMSILYPPKKQDFLVKMHEGSIQNREDDYLLTLLYEMVKSLAKSKKKIRILEAGAGYGTVLRKIAPLLRDCEVEYYFTDLGEQYLELFMRYAVQEKLEYIRFYVLDIEKTPHEQGIEEESFDIVLAYNVLHATFSIKTCLEHLSTLLKPGGLFGILERTKVRSYVDMVWGLAEGWWYYDDKEREISPIIDCTKWNELMSSSGMDEVRILPEKKGLSECVDASLILGYKKNDINTADILYSYQGKKGKYSISNHLVLKDDRKDIKNEVRKFLDWNKGFESVVILDYPWEESRPILSSSAKLHNENRVEQILKEEIVKETEVRKIACGFLSVINDQQQSADQILVDSKMDYYVNTKRLYVTENVCGENILDYLDEMSVSDIDTSVYGDINLTGCFKAEKRVENEREEDPMESLLRSEWERILGVSDFSIDDDFFELGGDSFKLIQLINNLEKKGYSLLMNEFYNYPTIRTLADYLSKNGTLGDRAIKLDSQMVKSVSEWFGKKAELINIVKGKDEKRVLIVGKENDTKEILQKLIEEEIDYKVFPDYVLNRVDDEDGIEQYQAQICGELSEQQVQEILNEHIAQQQKVSEALCNGEELYRYPISNMQKIHFKGDTRLQLYLIEMNQPIDLDILNRAFLDLVVTHGFMRSCLCGMRKNTWSEKIPPNAICLPMIDISRNSKEAQDKVIQRIIEWENKADFKCRNHLMYHVTLIKYSERKYDLLFQFDHSIFDLFSGQLIRLQLLRRYEELRQGRCNAMNLSCNYKAYLEQIRKGPIGITQEEFREKFKIGAYRIACSEIQEKIAQKRMKKNKLVTCLVDVGELIAKKENGDAMLELAIALSGMTLAELLDVKTVAIDLLFQNRKYGKLKYNDVMGMGVDGIPLVFDITENSLGEMQDKLKNMIADISKYNINFFNLVSDLKSFLKWGRIMQEVNQASNSKMFASCLINYAGNVEEEYSRIWDYSSSGEEESNLNYADYYVAVKSIDTKLEFHIICSFEQDVDKIKNIMEQQVKNLINLSSNANIKR